MSVINKNPFINELLGDLSSDELTALFACVNGQGDAPIFRTLKAWGSDLLTSDDKGVYPIKLEMNGPAAITYEGYLVYNDDWCVLISYSSEDAQALVIINITMPESGSDIKWEKVNEQLSITELRSELFDVANGSGGGGGTEVIANPTLAGTEDELTGIEIDGTKYAIPSNKSNSQVTIDNETVSLEEWIANCESGVYDSTYLGKIATVTNAINNSSIRFILIGVNHDVLANTDAGELEPNGTKAKTTWQFYDMPVQKVNLGLPYEEEKTGNVRCDQTGDIEDCPEVTIDTVYPSNMHGYTSAVGLLDALQCIFDSLPQKMQNAMKLVRKDCFISEIDDGDNYEMFDSTASMIFNEQDRYGSAVAQKLFCLSAFEMGYTKGNSANPDFPTTIEVEIDDEPTSIKLEGSKYAYFDEGNDSSAIAKRIRYFNGSAWYYWLRSPSVLDSRDWGFVFHDGVISSYYTNDDYGVAPAFCI